MDLDRLLRRAVELGAMPGAEPLTGDDLARIADIIGASAPSRLEEFRHSGDLDVAYQTEDLPRFRVNAFRQRGAISFAFRVIPKYVPSFADLSLPPGVRRHQQQRPERLVPHHLHRAGRPAGEPVYAQPNPPWRFAG